jgi:hypothetical protein
VSYRSLLVSVIEESAAGFRAVLGVLGKQSARFLISSSIRNLRILLVESSRCVCYVSYAQKIFRFH